MSKENPVPLAIFERQLTVGSAMSGKLIQQIEKENPTRLAQVVTRLIIRQAEFFNLKNNLTEEQSVMVAMDLIEVFNYESLEDIVLMFKYGRQGKLGEIYGRLDTETILSKWAPAYLELKAEEREKQHNEMKSDFQKPVDVDEKGVRKLDLMLKKLNSKTKESKEKQYGHRNFNRDIRLNSQNWDLKTLESKLETATNHENNEGISLLKIMIENRKKIEQLKSAK